MGLVDGLPPRSRFDDLPSMPTITHDRLLSDVGSAILRTDAAQAGVPWKTYGARFGLIGGKQAPAGAHNGTKTHCPQGHPYGAPGARGWRRCQQCRAEGMRRLRSRHVGSTSLGDGTSRPGRASASGRRLQVA